MCWSFPVSVGTWLFVCTVATVHYVRNKQPSDRWAALLFGYVGQMQLTEALMWLSQPCGWLNKAAGWALYALVLSQPLWHCGVAWRYGRGNLSRPVMQAGTLLIAVASAFTIAKTAPGQQQLCAQPGPDDGHLCWGWGANVTPGLRLLFLAAVCLPMVGMRPLGHTAAYLGTCCALFGYAHTHFAHTGAFESMWCWYAVSELLLPFVFQAASALRRRGSRGGVALVRKVR